MKNHLFLFVLILFFSSALSAQSTNWIKPYTPRIDSLFANLQQGNQPGLAVGIVKGGQLVLSKGYGLANLEHRLPFTPNTVSDIGSLAKQITCFALVLLAQRNQLSLDDNIRKYFPDVPDFGQPITKRLDESPNYARNFLDKCRDQRNCDERCLYGQRTC